MAALKVITTKYTLRENFLVRAMFLFKVWMFNVLSSVRAKGFKDFMRDKKLERVIEEVELSEEDYVVTCYFTSIKDPQHGIVRNKPDYKYIAPWYDSVLKLGIGGVIVHDGLEESFIDKYQTNKIQFVKYIPGEFSIFEERWMAYYLLINANPKVNKFFFTDGNDVIINHNPFKRHNEFKAYIGRDQANRVGDAGWVVDEFNEFIKESGYSVNNMIGYQPLFNAGLVGGPREIILSIVSKMVELALMGKTDNHKDMSLLNIAVLEIFSPKISYKYFQKNIVDPNNDVAEKLTMIETGYPLNSPFKCFETGDKATFCHK